MISVFGTYKNGKVLFDEDIKINEAVKVIVTFLQPENAAPKQLTWDDFNFDKVKNITQKLKGNISDSIIDERRNEE